MKKKVDKRINEKQPDVVFFDGIVMAQDKIEHQAIPVSMDINPSFGKAMFLSDDEQLDTKIFYVDDKDLEFIDKNLK